MLKIRYDGHWVEEPCNVTEELRFYVSPCKTRSKWLSPEEAAVSYLGWWDCTDMAMDKYLEFLAKD